MKKKKLCKRALQHPELYSEGELSYFRLWLKARKEKKARKLARLKLQLENSLHL